MQKGSVTVKPVSRYVAYVMNALGSSIANLENAFGGETPLTRGFKNLLAGTINSKPIDPPKSCECYAMQLSRYAVICSDHMTTENAFTPAKFVIAANCPDPRHAHHYLAMAYGMGFPAARVATEDTLAAAEAFLDEINDEDTAFDTYERLALLANMEVPHDAKGN